MKTFLSSLDHLLGIGLPPSQLEFQHLALRSLVVFISAVVMARVGDRRSLGRNAGFDVMLGVILGSVVSRAINGQAAFFPTLGAGFVLIFLHRLLGAAAFHSHFFSVLVKGRDRLLVKDGKVDVKEMRRTKITEDDLLENLRLEGQVRSPDEVLEARLERNGAVSVLKK